MDQNSSTRLYAAMGVAGQAGCLTVLFAVGSLLFGMWLDQALGTRRTWALICLVAGVPINLIVTLRITQRLIARVIPPDKPKERHSPASDDKADLSDNGDQL
jgi:hypothetical protein